LARRQVCRVERAASRAPAFRRAHAHHLLDTRPPPLRARAWLAQRRHLDWDATHTTRWQPGGGFFRVHAGRAAMLI
jgi:hypothetical protein